MRRLRVLVLMHEDLVPPATLPGDMRNKLYPWRTERDVLVGLRRLGHEVQELGVHDDLGAVRDAVASFAPDITFNVLEEFAGATAYAQAVIAFLELLRQPYTGCNPRGLVLAHDKVLTKKILAYHGIPTPRGVFYPRGGRVRIDRRLRFPLIVKSSFEDASLGIAQASVVHGARKLIERVQFMHEHFDTDVIAEEYVDGRELYVGLLGNGRVQTLPIWELSFSRWPAGSPRIATEKVKWDRAYQRARGIRSGAAVDLSARERRAIAGICRRTYRALGLSGYARIDLRLAHDGSIYVLEANGSPDLARDEDFAASARAAGIDYPALLQRILQLGLAWRPVWKQIALDASA